MSARKPDTADLAAEYLLGDKPRRTPTARRAAKATRMQEALTMRLAGVSIRTIATRMGVHPSTVYAWVRDAITGIPAEQADELRRLELERLDALFSAVWRDALAGDTKAIDVCLRLMTRRAALVNLDASHAAGLDAVESLLDRLVLGSEG
ncbi:helix-turn-helix domain-containing protein [Microbacterium sp.]|uniref:helix-turn-helix domain-containing protein n=1 Tax=Microbacterium sp. TaxID=51671 RepID=UPI0039E576E2